MDTEKHLVREFQAEVFENEYILHPAGEHNATVIWIHHIYKADVDPAPFLLKGPALELKNVRFVLPQAPSRVITADPNKTPVPSWFDVLCRDFNNPIEEVINVKDLSESAALLEKTIEREVKLLKGHSKRLFLGGFSQGTAMALTAGLQSKHRLGGIFTAHGYFPSVTEISESNQDVPVVVLWGKKPPFRPFDKPDGMYINADKTFDILKTRKTENTQIELVDGDVYYDQDSVQEKFVAFIKKHTA